MSGETLYVPFSHNLQTYISLNKYWFSSLHEHKQTNKPYFDNPDLYGLYIVLVMTCFIEMPYSCSQKYKIASVFCAMCILLSSVIY